MQADKKHEDQSRQPMTWPRTEPEACQVPCKSGNNCIATFGFSNHGNRIGTPQNAILERCVPILLQNHLQEKNSIHGSTIWCMKQTWRFFSGHLPITSVTQQHQGNTDNGTEGSTDHYPLENIVSEKSDANYMARCKCKKITWHCVSAKVHGTV
jgi:hypothetical protein